MDTPGRIIVRGGFSPSNVIHRNWSREKAIAIVLGPGRQAYRSGPGSHGGLSCDVGGLRLVHVAKRRVCVCAVSYTHLRAHETA